MERKDIVGELYVRGLHTLVERILANTDAHRPYEVLEEIESITQSQVVATTVFITPFLMLLSYLIVLSNKLS